jgi:hypothetical protein
MIASSAAYSVMVAVIAIDGVLLYRFFTRPPAAVRDTRH